jgi:transcription elongation GreA/GreB family factor
VERIPEPTEEWQDRPVVERECIAVEGLPDTLDRGRELELGHAEGSRYTVEIDDLVTYVNVDDPGNMLSVRIVHGNSDPRVGVISDQTPLAEALLGGEEGEVVEAHLPMGTTKFRIERVLRAAARGVSMA